MGVLGLPRHGRQQLGVLNWVRQRSAGHVQSSGYRIPRLALKARRGRPAIC